MNKLNKNLICASVLLIILTSFMISASPTFPSLVACEKDCKVYENDDSLCDNCFVQIIYTEDDKIDSPNKEGGATGDDLLLDYTFTGEEDFYNGMFTSTLSLAKGDKIYARAWDSRHPENSSYFGESEIIFINESKEDY